MVPNSPRLRVLSVGGNAISAFLSWRLQATNTCDVTLVWKSGFDTVSQYGISFKSTTFGNERFKPRHVVKVPEDVAIHNKGAFDYVLLCVKALPDVYDMASVIESVVTPKHTCILVNTTHTLGIEAHLETRFPSNVVLSLVCGAEITQLGTSEFEHRGSTEIWVGPANRNSTVSESSQLSMADALANTLGNGQIECRVSENIRQQQYERMIGPIAFHPLSVVFDTPSHASLIEKVGVRIMIQEILDELLSIATAQKCSFVPDFKERTIEEMIRPASFNSIMFQDYAARRPMEIETYLGSPIKQAQMTGIRVPRIETIYAILHNLNIANQQRKDYSVASPNSNTSNARISMAPLTSRVMNNGPVNGSTIGPGQAGRGRGRTTSANSPQPPLTRRGHPTNGMNSMPTNGYVRTISGPNGQHVQRNQSRRGSMEGNDLEEFSHLVLFDDIPESGENGYTVELSQIALRERELALRQRELALREQEMRLKAGAIAPRSSRRAQKPPSIRNAGFDDDDDDDYVDPADGPVSLPLIDPDSFDMMSLTSRRHRKAIPNQREIRKNPGMVDITPSVRRSNGFGLRHGFSRNRSSARIICPSPGNLHLDLMDDQLIGYSSNRYGNVDRAQMGLESRSNSLTATRLDELQSNGLMPGVFNNQRRKSNSPGIANSPALSKAGSRKPSPPHGQSAANSSGKPSPSGAPRQQIPRNIPVQVKSSPPHQIDQYSGVSAIPSNGPINYQNLTVNANASVGRTEITNHDSEPSVDNNQSNLGNRPPIGVR
ncbi:putative 2-dehydropantoate 2-reductase [Erysiphe neolycopersici]|uniref:Putative 2-dehydropantoate 2-reductase n=1 Tax=Erysiphe neolycopersici TaxID=212602 RepID=A0A420HVC1_9PEZI|nr:putative 2-dehydropantoate 2-reductase [Erysiphe neolycopersici]